MQIVTESTNTRALRIALDHDTQEMTRLYQPSIQRMEHPHKVHSHTEHRARAVHGVDHVLSAAAPVSNYNTNTIGGVSFIRVENERIVEDVQLQSKLESLCEALRSRY